MMKSKRPFSQLMLRNFSQLLDLGAKLDINPASDRTDGGERISRTVFGEATVVNSFVARESLAGAIVFRSLRGDSTQGRTRQLRKEGALTS